MSYKLHITGKAYGFVQLGLNYSTLSRLKIEKEDTSEDNSIDFYINNIDEEVRELLKELSRKTPKLQYNLTKITEK